MRTAEDIFSKYDKDHSGTLTKEEAMPLFKENFDIMKAKGAIPKHIHWSEEVFQHGFDEVDEDKNGVID